VFPPRRTAQHPPEPQRPPNLTTPSLPPLLTPPLNIIQHTPVEPAQAITWSHSDTTFLFLHRAYRCADSTFQHLSATTILHRYVLRPPRFRGIYYHLLNYYHHPSLPRNCCTTSTVPYHSNPAGFNTSRTRRTYNYTTLQVHATIPSVFISPTSAITLSHGVRNKITDDTSSPHRAHPIFHPKPKVTTTTNSFITQPLRLLVFPSTIFDEYTRWKKWRCNSVCRLEVKE
jgi:hypothetical protein